MLNLLNYSDEQFINDQIILKKIIDNSKFFLLDLISGNQDEDYRLIQPNFVHIYREYKNALVQIIIDRFIYLESQFLNIIKSGKKEFYEIFYMCGLTGTELKFKKTVIELLFMNIYGKTNDALIKNTMWNKVGNIPKRNIPANIYKIKKILEDIKDLLSGIGAILKSLEKVSLNAYAIEDVKDFLEKILKRK
ncbi:MAG: hypothetical protein ACPKQO_03270 [Nitrososphaeraceae archaeon]